MVIDSQVSRDPESCKEALQRGTGVPLKKDYEFCATTKGRPKGTPSLIIVHFSSTIATNLTQVLGISCTQREGRCQSSQQPTPQGAPGLSHQLHIATLYALQAHTQMLVDSGVASTQD